jgi:hypothetical protein
MQRWEQKPARSVARELSPCAVGAVRAGGKSHDQHTRLRVAKAGNWLAPIFRILVCLAFDARNFFAPFHKARTLAAFNDFLVE